MQVDTSVVHGAAVVVVTGDVDLSTATELERQLLEQVDACATAADGRKTVVVDLTAVEFIDSSALGVLVGVHKRAGTVGAALKLVCGDPRIERIFAITRLREVIPVFPTVDAALA